MLALGMCPTLATTTSVTNAVGMGLSTTAILMMSNLFISLLRKIIPERMRMPSYIVVIASFVTIVDFLMQLFCLLKSSAMASPSVILLNAGLWLCLPLVAWYSLLTVAY
jgi:Na+-translocating ferredoxin:NAD+ oxidoreductase RnfE subunit